MDRREHLKLLMLAAVGSERLLRAPLSAAQSSDFRSRWDEWPDMRWAGPAFWGNRLQDWSVRAGVLVCGATAPNRTLHCLTHRATGTSFETRVLVDASALADAPGRASMVGLRLGVEGRFDDYRSAAVHGAGMDVGVDADGALRIGEARSEETVPLATPFELHVSVEGSGTRARLALSLHSAEDGAELARLIRDDLESGDVLGNLSLLSHFTDPAEVEAAAVFADWRIGGAGISADPSASFGPIMFAQYTVHRGTLKLTAQLAPIERIRGIGAALEIRTQEGGWRVADTAAVDPLSRTVRFRVGSWDSSRAVPYRVRVTIPLRAGPSDFSYEGTVAREPAPAEPLKAAVFSCNADHGFPDDEVVRHVSHHEPGAVFFLGDQFYESTGGFGIQRSPVDGAALDMLHKWYMFGWSYRELFRHVPAAFIPDDHDVYHGNVWGEGGKMAPTDEGWGAVAQDQGGYKMPATWVNAVQMAQTSHLPDPYDPTTVGQGIGVYYTRWDYAGVSFAILEDRKFKSAPANVLPDEAQVVNGWIQNPDFDVRAHRDLPEAELLGARQMAFLEDWAEDWSGPAYMKVVMSQTNFAAVHTIPEEATSGAVLPSLPVPAPGEYVQGDKVAVDMDSNGWPAARRDEVLRILRRCAAFHVAGDQHLATVVRHGIDRFGDAGFSFTGPALNNIWPRRWWPPQALKEAPLEGAPAYAGDFFDGFGNRVTVHAAASPHTTGLEPKIIRDRATGYGIVTFDKQGETIRIDCWPRQVDPSAEGARQYEGWPLTVPRDSGDGREPVGFLPTLRVTGLADPVVEVRRRDGTPVYTRRIVGTEFTPPVFESGVHLVRVGDPSTGRWLERSVGRESWGQGTLELDFT